MRDSFFISLVGIVCIILLFVYFRVPLGDLPAAALAIAIWFNPLFQQFCNSAMSDVPSAFCWSRRSRPTPTTSAIGGLPS